MNRPMNDNRLRGLALGAACAVLLLGSAAAAQDSDDEGVLPHHGGDSSTTSASVGIAATMPGVDQLDPAAARLSIAALIGDTYLDTTVSPTDAMFVPTAPYRYEFGTSVGLQGDGQLILPAGYSVQMQAAPEATASIALLVVHPDSIGLPTLLSGGVAPSFIVTLGNLPSADLSVLQGLVETHADALPGLAVSLVYASLDKQGGLHVAAAKFTTDASAPVEVSIH